MARLFVAASSTSAKNAAAVDTSVTKTFAAWVRLAATGAVARTILAIRNPASAIQRNGWALEMNASEQIAARTSSSANSSVSTYTTTALTAGTWAHAGAVFGNVDDRTAFFNGLAATTQATSRSVTSPSVTDVGYEEISSGSTDQFWDGDLAEVAVWNAKLTAAEMLVLAAGYSPLFVRPQSLISYWEFIGRTSPEIDIVGKFDATLTNSPAASAHPRIIMPPSNVFLFPPTTVVAGTVPPLYMYYARQRA